MIRKDFTCWLIYPIFCHLIRREIQDHTHTQYHKVNETWKVIKKARKYKELF